jgi:2-phospho-L-lactate guanylyltransferase
MSSDIFVIIPAKPLNQSKTRLAAVLPLDERVELSRHLLQRTIHLARQVGQVVVVSRDAAVRRLAKQAGAWALVEAGKGLNKALQQASDWATAQGGQAILILPGDLPLLQEADLREMVAAGPTPPAVVIAPSRRLDGTNALFLRPPGLIPFVFGSGSFEQHQQAARAIGLEPVIHRSPTTALDLDVPTDLEAWGKRNELDPCHSERSAAKSPEGG